MVFQIFLKNPGKAASSPSAYRCISLASHAGKLLDRIMQDSIRKVNFLNIKEQYDFRKGRSTMNYLYQLIYDLKSEVKVKDPCSAAFFDLEKLFDSIDHNFFLYCLLKRGIRGRILPLIENLHKTKEVSVRVNDIGGISFNPSIFRSSEWCFTFKLQHFSQGFP